MIADTSLIIDIMKSEAAAVNKIKGVMKEVLLTLN
jgi:hypothetical protein